MTRSQQVLAGLGVAILVIYIATATAAIGGASPLVLTLVFAIGHTGRSDHPPKGGVSVVRRCPSGDEHAGVPVRPDGGRTRGSRSGHRTVVAGGHRLPGAALGRAASYRRIRLTDDSGSRQPGWSSWEAPTTPDRWGKQCIPSSQRLNPQGTSILHAADHLQRWPPARHRRRRLLRSPGRTASHPSRSFWSGSGICCSEGSCPLRQSLPGRVG